MTWLQPARDQPNAGFHMSKSETPADDSRTHQFTKHQTIAITMQVVPMCRELMVRADEFAYTADEGGNPDLDQLAQLLQEASDELDELATLAQVAD
jgi:hypothetical protein